MKKKNLYIIGGTMGVGKTTTCQLLKKKLSNSVFLDGDWCWDADPFQVTEETKSMVQKNICYLLNSFIHCSAYDNVIFCWVLHDQSIIDNLLNKIDVDDCNVKVISLVANEATLQMYELLDAVKIDTSDKTIEEITDEIISVEGKSIDSKTSKNEIRDFINHIDEMHTTEMGAQRIKKNLSLETDDIVGWCKENILSKDAIISKKGKNWYVQVGKNVITVNSYSYTIITAHKMK